MTTKVSPEKLKQVADYCVSQGGEFSIKRNEDGKKIVECKNIKNGFKEEIED